MGATIYGVLDELRDQATSESDKGSRLERLMAEYLRTDPVFAEQFSDVYLWRDWPGRGGKGDTGIDIVAIDSITGGNVAIQCKFYAPDRSVTKNDLDRFLSASGRRDFTQRIVVSTTDRDDVSKARSDRSNSATFSDVLTRLHLSRQTEDQYQQYDLLRRQANTSPSTQVFEMPLAGVCEEPFADWIGPRVLEMTYTCRRMAPYVRDILGLPDDADPG